MQSETAVFAAVPPPGELDETYESFLILAYLLDYVKTTSSTKPEVHGVCTAVTAGLSHCHM